MKYRIFELVPAVRINDADESFALKPVYIGYRWLFDSEIEAKKMIKTDIENQRYKSLVILPIIRYNHEEEV